MLAFFLFCALWTADAARARPEIQGVTAVDVTPSAFSVIFQVSEPAMPDIAVFSDPAGLDEITGELEVIPLPLAGGDPSLADERDRELSKTGIRELQRRRGLQRLRVRGCEPATAYYYRVFAVTDDARIGSSPAVELATVTTATETTFLAEARPLVVDVTGGVDARGWIVTASSEDAAHPVSAVVSDGAGASQAYLNLARFFGIDGRSWSPLGAQELRIEIRRGWQEQPTEANATVLFDGEFAVAESSGVSVAGDPSGVDADGDGMLDSWERENFGDLSRDGSGDADGDGLSDLGEFVRGTDPLKDNLPVIPQVYDPAPGSEVDTLLPELVVFRRSADLARSFAYVFELYLDEGYRLPVASEAVEAIDGEEFLAWPVPEELSEDTTYHWRARSSDGTSYSEWAHGSFLASARNDPPGAFSVSLPSPAEEVDSRSPLLEVTASADPEGDHVTYRFEVYADETLGDRVAVSDDLEAAGASVSWPVEPPLPDDGVYFWRAIARDEHGLETESAVASFAVNRANRAPPAPGIADPLEGDVVVDLEVDLVVENASDPDGDPLSYVFEIDTVPTFDSAAKRASGELPAGVTTTSWTVAGLEENTRYWWRARSRDGAAGSAWSGASFLVDLANDPPSVPVARNPDLESWVGSRRPRLSVHPSSDPEGGDILYRFELYTVEGDLVESGAAMRPSWDVSVELDDLTGYAWRARAEDEGGARSPWTDEVSFFVNTAVPRPPVADAGRDLYALVDALLSTDGTASRDARGRITFSWSFIDVPAGSGLGGADLIDPASPKPSFTPDASGEYVLELRVSNGDLPAIDEVVVRATAGQAAPNAVARPDRHALAGRAVELDGSRSSDPDGDPLAHLWTLVRSPRSSKLRSADIAGRETPFASFTPDVDGLYVFSLETSDGAESSADRVEVLAASRDVPPHADAGPDDELLPGATARLDGSSSDDPDGGPEAIAYGWRFLSLPAGSALDDGDIAGAGSPAPSFLPDVEGTYLVELEVRDGLHADTDNVAVTAGEAEPTDLFVRGDTNVDGGINITDAILPLHFLFLGLAEPPCFDAADTDDNGAVELTDAIVILQWLFLGEPPPREPSPSTGSYLAEDCGPDPSEDALDCASPPPPCE